MYWDVTEVKVIDDKAIHVRFKDGLEGDVRFGPNFFCGVFSHLVDPHRFRDVGVVGGAVTWPGELDLAPDRMHADIVARGECVLGAEAL
jgi:Protein of unknown function (DUF2442)